MDAVDILVVDDDPKMVENLKEVLEEEGYRVTSFEDPRPALDALKKQRFTIALVDLIMPGKNGIELLRGVKEYSPDTKVIIITGFATIESAVDAMKVGAADYISKPFKINEIQTAIKRTLEEIRFEDDMVKAAKVPESDKVIKAICNPIRRGVLSFLKARGGMRFTDIKRGLSVEDPTKLSFHLRELKESGLLMQNPQKMYSLTRVGLKTARLLKELESDTY